MTVQMELLYIYLTEITKRPMYGPNFDFSFSRNQYVCSFWENFSLGSKASNALGSGKRIIPFR